MALSLISPQSGINASIIRQNVTSHDVANINTPGFKERVPYQAEKKEEGVEISHIGKTTMHNTGLSNTNLAEETKEQLVNKNTLKANAAVLRVKDQMIGETIDLMA